MCIRDSNETCWGKLAAASWARCPCSPATAGNKTKDRVKRPAAARPLREGFMPGRCSLLAITLIPPPIPRGFHQANPVGLAWWNPRGIGGGIKVIASKLHLPGMKPSRSGRAAAGLLTLSLVLFPAVAGLQGHRAQDAAANLPQQVSLYGTAFLSTPLTGANVNVYESV